MITQVLTHHSGDSQFWMAVKAYYLKAGLFGTGAEKN